MTVHAIALILLVATGPALPQSTAGAELDSVTSETSAQSSSHEPGKTTEESRGSFGAEDQTSAATAPMAPPQVASDAPSRIRHAPGRAFRNQGDLFIAGESAFDLGGRYVSTNGRSETDFSFLLQLGVGYFVTKHFAAGGFLSSSVAGGSGTRAAGFAIGPRLTARLGLGARSSFLPSLALGYSLVHTGAGGGFANSNANLFVTELYLPFALDVVPGVLVTVGPYVRPAAGRLSAGPVSVGTSRVDFGLSLGILGWR